MNLTLPRAIPKFGQKDMEKELRETGEIVVYQPDEITRLEVRVEDDTVWLTQEPLSATHYLFKWFSFSGLKK